MGRRKSLATSAKPQRRKKVTVKLIPRVHAGEVTEPWALMEEIKTKEYAHLADAKVAMAWRLGWRADPNGILRLGQCKKRGDLDRELDTFDFVILLNKEAWLGLNATQKRALIDHELNHAQITVDADGNPKTDDSNRPVCRIRKHDCEEFRCIVERHGLWTSDLAALAAAAVNDAKRSLLPPEEAGGNGEEAKAGDPKAWRRVKIENVVTNEKLAEKLVEADLTTLGKLSDHMAEQGQWWWKQLPGIGEAAAEKISDMLASFWEAHPEYTAVEPAAV